MHAPERRAVTSYHQVLLRGLDRVLHQTSSFMDRGFQK